jgi:hypothetical protein
MLAVQERFLSSASSLLYSGSVGTTRSQPHYGDVVELVYTVDLKSAAQAYGFESHRPH